jgi:hypothetical protein
VLGSRTPGSRREWQRRQMQLARERGRAGPSTAEILPVYAALVAVVALPVWLLTLAWRYLGALGLVPALLLLAAVGFVAYRWQRAERRRRRGHFRRAELEVASDREVVTMVRRVLNRDGWHVASAPWQGRPRLIAQHPGTGAVLDVCFRERGEDAQETNVTPAPARTVLRVVDATPSADGITRLIVSRGRYSRSEVLWASRQLGLHLVDHPRLRLWIAGQPLHQVLGLPPLERSA